MRKLIALGGLAALTLMAAPAWSAYVHVNSLPTALATFNKDTGSYMYFEGEKDSYFTAATDSFADTRDQSHTVFVNATYAISGWSSQVVYDGARYASYGSATANLTNVNAYWENIAGITAGTYDVYLRVYPNAATGSSETFNLFAGTNKAGTDVATSLATLQVTDYSAAKWYTLGRIALTSGQDSLRLRTDTTVSNVRFDTLLMVAVPEPVVTVPLLLLLGGLAMSRRRSEARQDA